MYQLSSLTPTLFDASDWITPLLLIALLAVIILLHDGKDVSDGSAWVARSIFSIAVVLACGVMLVGPMVIELVAWGQAKLAVRVDPFSSVMLVVVSLLGLAAAHYAVHRLDGHPVQARFSRRLVAVLTCLVLLVLSNTWLMIFALTIMTGFSLHLLLDLHRNKEELSTSKINPCRTSDGGCQSA